MIQGFVVLAIAGCMWASVCLAVPTSENVKKSPEVVLKTDKGDITIRLDAEKAPKSVANFLQYVNEGFYDGTIFHRVIKNFMIQGGGFTADMNQKPTHAPVVNEADNGLKNKRGSIAMARTADPDSATAQFFINVVDNPFLDHRAKTRPIMVTPCLAKWLMDSTLSTPSEMFQQAMRVCIKTFQRNLSRLSAPK